MYDSKPNQSKRRGGQDSKMAAVFSRKCKEKLKNQQSKWVSKPEPRHRYRVSSNSESPNPNVDDVRGNLSSSSLVEEPARALVRAFGRTLLGLHPVGQPSGKPAAHQSHIGPRRLHRRLCLRRRPLGGGDLAARSLGDRAQGGYADCRAENGQPHPRHRQAVTASNPP